MLTLVRPGGKPIVLSGLGATRRTGRPLRRMRGFGQNDSSMVNYDVPSTDQSVSGGESIPSDIYDLLYPAADADDVYNEDLYEGYGRLQMTRERKIGKNTYNPIYKPNRPSGMRGMGHMRFGQTDNTQTPTTTVVTTSNVNKYIKYVAIAGAVYFGYKYFFKRHHT